MSISLQKKLQFIPVINLFFAIVLIIKFWQCNMQKDITKDAFFLMLWLLATNLPRMLIAMIFKISLLNTILLYLSFYLDGIIFAHFSIKISEKMLAEKNARKTML